jgi:hypothetical protein
MKYTVELKYINPSHEHVSLRRRVDTVTRLVEASSEQEAINRAANQQRALGFMIKEASVVKPELIKEEVEQIDEGKNEDSKTHWETNVAPVWEKHGLSPKFAKAVDAHVKKHGDSQVWNYHGSAGGAYPHWFDSKKGQVKPLRQKTGYEIDESWEVSNEEAEQIDEVNEKQIKKDLDSGMSHDAVIGKHANKKLTNTDAIRKVIKQHAFDKRMKKEEVEQVDEAEREAGYKMSPAVKAAQAKSDALSKVKKPAQAGTLAAQKAKKAADKMVSKAKNNKTVNLEPSIEAGKENA